MKEFLHAGLYGEGMVTGLEKARRGTGKGKHANAASSRCRREFLQGAPGAAEFVPFFTIGGSASQRNAAMVGRRVLPPREECGARKR